MRYIHTYTYTYTYIMRYIYIHIHIHIHIHYISDLDIYWHTHWPIPRNTQRRLLQFRDFTAHAGGARLDRRRLAEWVDWWLIVFCWWLFWLTFYFSVDVSKLSNIHFSNSLTFSNLAETSISGECCFFDSAPPSDATRRRPYLFGSAWPDATQFHHQNSWHW